MQQFKDSWVGRATYTVGRGITKVPEQVWSGLTLATAGAIAGYSALIRHETGVGRTLAEYVVDPIHALHAVGGATAAYVGLKRKSLVDLVVPAGIVAADNVFRKVTDSGYTFEQLASDVRPEFIGIGALYLLGLGVSKMISKKKTP